MENELYHHGIKGQRWGIRRFQNADGSLTEAGKKRLQKKDMRWAKRNEKHITSKAYNASKRELNRYSRKELKDYDERSRAYMNKYNQKMAELMSEKASNYSTPSGKVVRFVAKRGEMGVYMAIADRDYDMRKVQKGIWNDGRVAYRKDKVGKSNGK